METLKSKFDILDTISDTKYNTVTLIRKKETEDYFLLKSFKEREGSSKKQIDRKILFRKEINILSSFDHPNIVKLADTYFDGKKYYLFFPHRPGKTLQALLQEGMPFTCSDSLNLVIQLLNALEYVHLRGIIHCDINPNNIFVDDEKGVTLLDFGNALTEEEAIKLPEGTIIGTPPYLSIEQLGLTEYKIDTRSDLFCTAIILFRLLSSKLPFSIENDSIEELVNKIPKIEVQPIKDLPAILNAIIIKSLKPSPDERFQTASGFKHDLMIAAEDINEKQSRLVSVGEADNVAAINRLKLFVAREHEITALKKGFEQFQRGIFSSFLLYGKSGIGKTYIINQFRIQTIEEGFFFLSAKCNRFTTTQPYSILQHIILEFILKISALPEGEIDNFKKIINDKLLDYSGIICQRIPEIKQYFKEVKEVSKVEKEKEADLINHALTVLLKTLCGVKPLILFIDDLQWIDLTTFDILKNLLQQKPESMIIFNYRIEKKHQELYAFGNDLKKIGITHIIPIEYFTKNEIKELIYSRFSDIEETDLLADILSNKTDSSPFSLIEAIRYLVNNSVLHFTHRGWQLKKPEVKTLPEKFDTTSLILTKLNWLNEEEKRYLKLASLIEGKIDRNIIESFGSFVPEASKTISHRLESLGFITRQLTGHYSFTHDKVKEVILNSIPKKEQLILYEKLAQLYESLMTSNKEYIFDATECYLKSSNLTKSIEYCFNAATYAVEKIAFDVAIHYFKITLLMVKQSIYANISVTINLIKIQMAFGDVLMLTGKNQEALKAFQKILAENVDLTENEILEIKYKIGSIYHNMGEFENSIPFFIETLEKLKIKIPKKRHLLTISLIVEISIQFIFSCGLKYLLLKKNSYTDHLIVKILNKLGYSCYFEDMNLAYYTHFKALNRADQLKDCPEKVESYCEQGVGAYQIFFKGRAFSYLKKSLLIAKSIKRDDSYAFASYMSGIVCYFNSRWEKCIDYLNSSIELFNNIGDFSSQPQCAEPIWKVHLIRGELKLAGEAIRRTIELSKKVNEKHFFVNALAGLHYINFLITGKINNKEIDEINYLLKQVDSFLSQTDVNISIIKVELLQYNLSKAYVLIKPLLIIIKKKEFNSEYYVPYYSMLCEIIISELINRKNNRNSQLPISNNKLRKEFLLNLFILWFSCLSYPAYWGAYYRNLAWHNALKGKKKKAKKYFLKSIQKHHTLDMRYEEAKSIRDYAMFLEECNLPGEARDQYNEAYRLFFICGAKLETDRLKGKVDYDTDLVNLTMTPEKEKEYTISDKNVSQVQVDTLYDLSSSLTGIDDIDLLFKQILGTMIRTTGAQFAWLFLEGNNRFEKRDICIDHHNTVRESGEIPFSRAVVEKVKEEKKTVLIRDISKEKSQFDLEDDTHRIDLIRSVLCVPLMHLDNYLGCVYLGNNIVSGLFTDESKKIAQILASQAGVFLENAYLMDEYKKLNKYLQQKVKEQTKDIREKNNKLLEFNLKIMESERMKSILTGTIVHDIKNYAAGMEGNIGNLERKYLNDELLKRKLSLINNGCFDIVNLASNLLDIGKMEESKLEPKKQFIPYEQLCKIITQFKDNVLLEERNITTHIIPPEGVFALEADQYLLTRVFQNLFNNASKYAPKNGSVIITMKAETHEDMVSFYCSGTPIPEKDREIIFDKYSRIEDKRSLYSKGLGLFFCRMVAHAHGGKMWLETDDNGNYFKMTFRKSLERVAVQICR